MGDIKNREDPEKRGRASAGYQDDGSSEFSPTNTRKGANFTNQTFGQKAGRVNLMSEGQFLAQ